MKFIYTGKQIDSSGAFNEQLEKHLHEISKKYGLEPIEAQCNLYRVGHGNHHFRLDCSLHVSRGMYVRCSGESADAYATLVDFAKRLDAKLRRQKKRLDAHNRRRNIHAQTKEPLIAPSYVLPAEEAEDTPDDEACPPVIAEVETDIPDLSVSEAVMRLDLSEEPALVFTNTGNGELNVLYRRSDGNIGWIDPQIMKKG